MLFVLMRSNRPVQVSGDMFSLHFRQTDEIISIESLDELIEEEPDPTEELSDTLEAPDQQIGTSKPHSKGYLIYQ